MHLKARDMVVWIKDSAVQYGTLWDIAEAMAEHARKFLIERVIVPFKMSQLQTKYEDRVKEH